MKYFQNIFRKKEDKNAVFDIHPRQGSGWSRPRRTVSLRRRFYNRHPIATASGVLALVLVAVLTADTFLGHANTTYWYPDNCLGGWVNSQNAAETPDLLPGAEPDEFTPENSAILENSISQIYCGGWSGDAPEDTVPEKAILRLSIAFRSPLDVIASSTPSSSEPSISFQQDLLSTTSTSQEAQTSSTPETAEQEADEVKIEIGETNTTSTVIEEGLPPAEDLKEEDGLDPEPNTEAGEESAETEESVPEEPAVTDEEPEEVEEETSFLRFVQVAFAQESGSSTILETQDEASETVEPEVIADDSVLEVRYSFDDEGWNSLGSVSVAGGEDLEFLLPIRSWDQLQDLQISLASLEAADALPLIYLDGMSLAIEYGPLAQKEPEAISQIAAPSSTEVDDPGLPEEGIEQEFFPAPDLAKLKERVIGREIVIDGQAAHSCSVEPFRTEISTGKTYSAQVVLSAAGSDLPQKLEVGNLPAGIEVVFSDNSDYVYRPEPKNNLVGLSISSGAGSPKGDFSIAVIYSLEGSTPSSVVCQMNVVNE